MAVDLSNFGIAGSNPDLGMGTFSRFRVERLLRLYYLCETNMQGLTAAESVLKQKEPLNVCSGRNVAILSDSGRYRNLPSNVLPAPDRTPNKTL